MRSRIVSSAWRGARMGVAAALSFLAPLWTTPGALADTKQECSQAYDETQVLRDADQLEQAIAQADICARPVCAKFIRDDCTKWKADLEARISTLIVEAVDASGARVLQGTVTLDGAPWIEQLDGSAHVISKGSHTLEVRVKGAAPHQQTITVAEGEKNRKITISLVAQAPAPEAPTVHKVGPFLVGGLGVASLIAGAVTGGLVVDAYSVVQDECSDETQTCSRAGLDAQERGHLLGPLTTGLLVGGGVLLGAGIIWLVVARTTTPAPASSAWVLAPVLSLEHAGLVAGGAF